MKNEWYKSAWMRKFKVAQIPSIFPFLFDKNDEWFIYIKNNQP